MATTAYSRTPGPQRAGALPLRLGVPSSVEVDASRRLGSPRSRAAAALDEIVEVDLEPFLAAGRTALRGPVAWRSATRPSGTRSTRRTSTPSCATVIRGGAGIVGRRRVPRPREVLAALAARAARTWDAVDVLLLPTAPCHPTHEEVAADPIGVNDRLGTYTTFANLLDLCAVSIPAGQRSDGLPFGVTLLAPAFGDAALLDLAARWPAAADVPVELAVCGAHMRGQPLNGQLLGLGARFVRATTTAPAYRLYALPGGERPGLVRTPGGRPIEVEVWRLSAAALGALLARVPPPLAIGTVELADGSQPRGFLCEPHAVADAPDISLHGSWQAYLEMQEAPAGDRSPAL